MKNRQPLISIITVVYNGVDFLEETIQSVLNQEYENIEYIIIDGGSTDGTVDIIKNYEEHIDYWVSEADGGIYDAMNKGITVSNGEIVGIVNADDTLYPDTIKKVCEKINFDNLDYIYGSIDLMDENGTIIGKTIPMDEKDIFLKKYIDMPFPHPSLFVTKDVYRQIGLYDVQFKLSADYDFVLRLLDKDYKGSVLFEPTGKFRSGGSSGGIATFVDTKNVLLSHNAPKFSVYKNMIISIGKVFILKYFPKFALFIRKKFRKKSRHKIYSNENKR